MPRKNNKPRKSGSKRGSKKNSVKWLRGDFNGLAKPNQSYPRISIAITPSMRKDTEIYEKLRKQFSFCK